jgi:hypothetical protein
MERPKYFWRIFQTSWAFARLPFDIDKWLTSLPQGWRLSFGFWMRVTVDEGATTQWREVGKIAPKNMENMFVDTLAG